MWANWNNNYNTPVFISYREHVAYNTVLQSTYFEENQDRNIILYSKATQFKRYKYNNTQFKR